MQLATEVDVGGEDLGQLRRHRVRNAGFVGRGEQGGADRAAGQERLRRQRRQRRVGDQLAGDALDAQARELGRQLVVARRGEAGDQLLELAGGVDAHLHPLAGTAVEQLPGDRIGAQEGGGGRGR